MTDILGSVSSELDEREVAKAALLAAEEQLESLCASHAGTFVSVERRGKALQDSLQELLNSIKLVDEKAQTAKQNLNQEDEDAGESTIAALSERHRVRRRTLLQHSSLLELLELPSLMDACVRSSLYDEALSIASFSNTLERRHKNNNQVVTSVIDQIRARQTDLRRIVLHRLKSSVTMPECLEIVTALRRLNSIDLEHQSTEANMERVHAAMEAKLKVDFLEARDVWLDAKVESSTSSSATVFVSQRSSSNLAAPEQLLDLIERYRTRLFEVTTQYNAIFRAQAKSTDSTVSLLRMWMARRVRVFLALLTSELEIVQDSASLRDALEASVFFSSSMGRLGADFTALLPTIFEKRMLTLLESIWKKGVDHLRETLSICRQAGVASPLLSHGADDTDAEVDSSASLADPQAAPRILLGLPPLARFVNSILTGLNELRRCLMPGIFTALRKVLENDVLLVVKTELMNNERAVLKPGFRGEAAQLREAAARFKSVFGDIVDPYVRGSLEAAIGNSSGAEALYQVYLDNMKSLTEEAAQELTEATGEAAETAEEPDATTSTEKPDDSEVSAPSETVAQE